MAGLPIYPEVIISRDRGTIRGAATANFDAVCEIIRRQDTDAYEAGAFAHFNQVMGKLGLDDIAWVLMTAGNPLPKERSLVPVREVVPPIRIDTADPGAVEFLLEITEEAMEDLHRPPMRMGRVSTHCMGETGRRPPLLRRKMICRVAADGIIRASYVMVKEMRTLRALEKD